MTRSQKWLLVTGIKRIFHWCLMCASSASDTCWLCVLCMLRRCTQLTTTLSCMQRRAAGFYETTENVHHEDQLAIWVCLTTTLKQYGFLEGFCKNFRLYRTTGRLSWKCLAWKIKQLTVKDRLSVYKETWATFIQSLWCIDLALRLFKHSPRPCIPVTLQTFSSPLHVTQGCSCLSSGRGRGRTYRFSWRISTHPFMMVCYLNPVFTFIYWQKKEADSLLNAKQIKTIHFDK